MTAFMLLNTAAISPVSAESVLSGDYTFVDTCYSPEKGLYVTVAKKLSEKTYTPAQIWVSDDMENWKKTKDFSQAIHNANPETRQTIVWWDAMQMFVVQMNNKVYYSQDAAKWTAVTNDNINGSNQTITTNGDKLVISSRARIKVCSNLEDDPEIFVIDATANNNTYGKAIGVTPNEPYTYMVTDWYKTWMINPDGNLLSATPNLSAHPFEMVWVDAFGGWIVVNGTSVLRILSGSEVKYSNFGSMVLSDGTSNEAAFTAAEATSDYVVVGTDDGSFYIAPNDSSSLTIDVPWEIMQTGTANENAEKIRSITAVDNERFLAVSDKTIFMLDRDEEGLWKYYDVSAADMALDYSRIEIPAEGTFTCRLEPVNYNCKGDVSEDPIISFELKSSLPEGITSEPDGDTAAELSIDSSVTGGHQLKYKAVTEKGMTKEFTITIVDEDHVEIRGLDEAAVPLENEEPEFYEYSAVAVGTDGLDMAREVSLEPISIPDGAEYDSDNKRLILNSGVSNCDIVFRAQSICKPSNSAEKTVKVSLREPRRMELVSGETELYIPDSGSSEITYAVKIYDQMGKEMARVQPIWSITPVGTETTDAVSIDANTGILKIDSSAVLGTIKIKAVSDIKEDVNYETEVNLLYTDLRKALEDISEFTIDTSQPITENINIMPKRTFGSTVVWRSSDESLIKTDGTVIRPSRADKEVTLTQVVKQNRASTEKKYQLTVKKADNLLTNGDFSAGTADGWQAKEGADFTLLEEGENKVLKVTGGTYRTLTLTNDSSFAFEAKVKAEAGSEVRLVSEKAGKLAAVTADGEYAELKASFDYRKQKNSFEDKIYIECDNAVTIDYLKAYEITLELNEVSAAVNKAVYTKAQSDIDSARTLLNGFYDLPIRNTLTSKLNGIKPSSGGSSGGGGGGGAVSKKDTAPSKADADTGNDIAPPSPLAKDDDEHNDTLDTCLLSFKDMKHHWAREDVEYMASLGVAEGDGTGIYRPDDTITRAELAVLLTRTMGLSETPYENSFFDVVSDDWYSGYVQTCRSNDYMNGYDGLFNPNSNITREEIAKVIVSAYNSKSGKKLERGKALYFNDIDSMSYWAYDYIAEAAELGFVNGITEELFAPKNTSTRAEAAVMLRRIYDKLNKAD